MNNIDYILHLGAGICSELQEYLNQSPEHIFLYEAVPTSFEALKAITKAYDNVSVYNEAVTVSEQEGEFFITKPEQFSGICSPEPFKAKFKNLQIMGSIPVSGLTLSNIVERHPELRDANKKSMVVIQLNGLETELINNLDIELLALFDTVSIQSPKYIMAESEHSEYEGAINNLTNYGFDLVESEQENSDAVYSYLTLKKNASKLEKTKLYKVIAGLESDNKKLNHALDDLSKQAADFKAQSEDELERYQQTVTEEFFALADEISKLEDEREKLKAESKTLREEKELVTSENSELASQNSNLKSETQALIAKRKQQEKESELVKATFEAESSELANQVSELISQNQLLTTEQGKLEEENNSIKAKFEAENSKLASQISNLKSQNQTLTAERNKQEEESKLTKATLEAEALELANQVSELISKNQLLATEQGKLEEENNSIKAKFEAESLELANQVSELISQNQLLTTEQEKLEEEINSIKAKFEAENSKLVNQISNLKSQNQTLIAEQTHWHQKSKDRAELLKTQLENTQYELAEANRTVNLNQKMLAKTHIDLEHLRDSYAKKVESEQELIELVRELKEKLTLASKYYCQLQQEHPELLTSTRPETER